MALPEIMHTWLFLNQLAQGVYSQKIGLTYFNGRAQEEKKLTLKTLAFMASQANANEYDVQTAKEQTNIPAGYVSCFEPPDDCFAGRLCQVNENGSDRRFDKNDFIFLLTIFQIANDRCRQECGPDCRHWWHRDLGDPAIVEELFPRQRRWWQFWKI